MGCATTSVKITSIVLNAILAFLAVGAIGWIAFYADTESEEFVIAAYVACAIILLFAFLGIYAAVRESVCLTATSAVFLLLLAIPQIVSTIMFVHQFEVKSAQTTVELAWQANNMDGLQQKYECCGKSSAQDYVHLRQLIPPSCYIDLDQKPEHLYVDGCIEKLQSRYESDKLRFIIVSWVLVAFELLCFVIAVFLAISFRNKQRRLQF
ncbi:PREDICTED: protein late bloomer [Drosophila arizonae]|uniref:Protein late bloomer n=1 Tax=Drosophila arizonae TaxID=7263 RepID=A0ABM1PLZ3_DROAR|nr:PREDICTED: protein late bloomer [Drosophila arizonae]XP_017868229.1 PREDICTED: protein late bloomer [Drosophila arizonae]